jgi:hypothetical protein
MSQFGRSNRQFSLPQPAKESGRGTGGANGSAGGGAMTVDNWGVPAAGLGLVLIVAMQVKGLMGSGNEVEAHPDMTCVRFRQKPKEQTDASMVNLATVSTDDIIKELKLRGEGKLGTGAAALESRLAGGLHSSE